MPASSSASSSNRPAGPTNGCPSRSSRSPGCSPTSISSERGSPSPKTVWVPVRQSGHAWQPAAASRSEVSDSRAGRYSAAVRVSTFGDMSVTYQRPPLLHRVVDSPIDMVSAMSENGRLRAIAELAVKVGANVGEGQYVLVTALVEHAPLVREIATSLRARRPLRRRRLPRPARSPRDDREGPRRDARVEPGVGA